MFFVHARTEIARGQGAATARLRLQYVAAFDRVHRIFEQEHAANVVWVRR
jgi:hypothetical protein